MTKFQPSQQSVPETAAALRNDCSQNQCQLQQTAQALETLSLDQGDLVFRKIQFTQTGKAFEHVGPQLGQPEPKTSGFRNIHSERIILDTQGYF